VTLASADAAQIQIVRPFTNGLHRDYCENIRRHETLTDRAAWIPCRRVRTMTMSPRPKTRRLTPRRRSLRLLLVAAALALVAVPAATAAPAATLRASSGCDLQVINDWLHDGHVDKLYAIPCYTQAIQRLNSMPDVKGYSSATDDIHDALLAAIRQDRGGGTGGPGGDGGSDPSSGGGSKAGGGGDGTSAGGGSGDKSVIRHLADRLGPGDAQSIPLPLLILGGLAVLLLLAALATWLARRLQARRMTPAPAPAPRR
jgi:hypothetical protein